SAASGEGENPRGWGGSPRGLAPPPARKRHKTPNARQNQRCPPPPPGPGVFAPTSPSYPRKKHHNFAPPPPFSPPGRQKNGHKSRNLASGPANFPVADRPRTMLLTTWRSPFIMICRKPLPGRNGRLAFH